MASVYSIDPLVTFVETFLQFVSFLHVNQVSYLMNNQLIVWCLTPFSTEFQLYHSSHCTYQCFPGVLLTSTPHNILSKPLAAFPHNHF